jgi:hypothetical protein
MTLWPKQVVEKRKYVKVHRNCFGDGIKSLLIYNKTGCKITKFAKDDLELGIDRYSTGVQLLDLMTIRE